MIHLLPSLDVGGREKIVFELAKRLDKRQFDIVVCCLRNHGKLYKLFKNENIKIKSFEKEKGVDMGLPFKLRKYFREQKAEIIHIHNPGALIYGAMGSIIGGNPVVLNTEHGFSYKEKLSVRILDQFFRNIIDMNICVSKKLKNELSSHIFFKQKIITIHNGAEVPSGKSNLLLSLKEKRKNNGFGDSDIIIGNIGRLKEVKNHHLLIKAMKNVIDKNRLVKLLIVGDGPLRGELEELTRSLKISKNVVFWGETENVHDLLDIMDIFV
ncbi:MAG: glycosyltransferase, partial [Candidatus Dadabacteria bacterium]|nr:glycosyltransferase [Candidatus Dadabacteria bacterium]